MSYVYPISSSKSKAIENTNIHLLDNTSIICLILDSQYWSHLWPKVFGRKSYKAKFYLFNLKISLSYSTF